MSQSKSNTDSPPTGIERRKTRRRSILETFSISLVIPKKGIHKLRIKNISEDGVGFDLDEEGESFEHFPVKINDSIDLRFYLNQSLYIPLTISVVRIEQHPSIRHVGAKFKEKSTPHYKSFLALLELVDRISENLEVIP